METTEHAQSCSRIPICSYSYEVQKPGRCQPPATAAVLYPPQSEMSLQSPRDWSSHGAQPAAQPPNLPTPTPPWNNIGGPQGECIHGASAEDVKHPRDSDATSSTAAGDDNVYQLRPAPFGRRNPPDEGRKRNLFQLQEAYGSNGAGVAFRGSVCPVAGVEPESDGGALAC
ncbi:unnamed protein product [Boreogadus saida]